MSSKPRGVSFGSQTVAGLLGSLLLALGAPRAAASNSSANSCEDCHRKQIDAETDAGSRQP